MWDAHKGISYCASSMEHIIVLVLAYIDNCLVLCIEKEL